MPTSKPSPFEAQSRHSDRYGSRAQAEAEVRHRLYLEVRGHLRAGWDQLPDGLTQRNLRELAVMAKARSDHRIHALCSRAGVRQTECPTP